MIDEITTLSHKFALIVYLLYSLDDESNPVSFASVLVFKSHIMMLDFWIATISYFLFICASIVMDTQIGFSVHEKGSEANKMHQIHFRSPFPTSLDAYGVSISAPLAPRLPRAPLLHTATLTTVRIGLYAMRMRHNDGTMRQQSPPCLTRSHRRMNKYS